MEMEKIVSLCKRRGFLFQSSEIYGGLNGFWDYGPLGVELKRNVKESWWHDMVVSHNELDVPRGAPATYEMTGLDCTIIMHPQVWKCSGHYDLFVDQMVDCRESKKRYRYDQIKGRWFYCPGRQVKAPPRVVQERAVKPIVVEAQQRTVDRVFITTMAEDDPEVDVRSRALKLFGLRSKDADQLQFDGGLVSLDKVDLSDLDVVLGPDAKKLGTLTAPRDFNLMFPTTVGALGDKEKDLAFLRPETAQGIFVNFKNVLDSTRVRVPFGIAQMGKSFRNEITPRNFTFRSREFEQMEIEFFCHPQTSRAWYEYWRDRRLRWYTELGLASDRLQMREHGADELSHYSCGTADIEYAFPFLSEGEFGELEGVAHRADFDLRSHMEGKLVKDASGCLVVQRDENGQPRWRGSGKDLTYFDDEGFERDKEQLGVKSFKEYLKSRTDEERPGWPFQYVPHVIEPSAGADRATLAFLCEAYTEDEAPDEKGKMKQRLVMKFHPRLAPIKAAVFPLVKKDGMPERAKEIYGALKAAGVTAFYDEKGAVGRRYRRQDEIGTPYCITVDGQTLEDNTVTVRDRDSLDQWRVKLDDAVAEIQRRLK